MKKSGAKQFVIDDTLKIYNVLISFHEQENRNSSDRITLRQLRLFSRPRRIIFEYSKKKRRRIFISHAFDIRSFSVCNNADVFMRQ